jgi:putative DNA primase/helicase
MNNEQSVLLQLSDFGIQLRPRDRIEPDGRKRTVGKGGKYWVKLHTFSPDAGGSYIVGAFGSYRTGDWQKVEVDWAPLSEAERERAARERAARVEAEHKARAEEAALAALTAAELLIQARREGASPYLERKQVQAESCRYLPDGTLVLPLMRYDLPVAQRLRAVQRILPDGRKLFTKGFEKPGCCVRLGAIDAKLNALMMVCEGYATGLTARMATLRQHPVFVALDAGNLAHVVPLLRALYPRTRILILADDDWLTKDQHTGELVNPGVSAARAIAKKVEGCDFVTPIFAADKREAKDTDFNDLHVREGLDAVHRQLSGVVTAMARRYG